MNKENTIYSLLVLSALILVCVGVGYRLLVVHPVQNTSEGINQNQTPTVPAKTNFFLEVTSPQDGVTVNINKIEIKGRAAADSEIFVNDTQVIPQADGQFSLTVTLQEGENPILITAGNDVADLEVERTVYYELP